MKSYQILISLLFFPSWLNFSFSLPLKLSNHCPKFLPYDLLSMRGLTLG